MSATDNAVRIDSEPIRLPTPLTPGIPFSEQTPGDGERVVTWDAQDTLFEGNFTREHEANYKTRKNVVVDCDGNWTCGDYWLPADVFRKERGL